MIELLLLLLVVGAFSTRAKWWQGQAVQNAVASPDRAAAVSAIAAQMHEHGITIDELAAAMQNTAAPRLALATAPARGDTATRLFSTLGGIFIFAGVEVAIASFWGDMNSVMRVLITLGFGIVLQVLAVVSLNSQRYARSANVLLLIAVVMQTGGWAVMIHEWFNYGGDPRYAALFIAGVMGLQQAGMFLRYPLTLVMFNLLFFFYAFVLTLLSLFDARPNISILLLGVSMMALAHAVNRTPHAALSGLGFLIGGTMFYSALFDMVRATPLELIYLGAVCSLIYISTLVRSGALLTVSTIAMLCYIGYYTEKYFVHSVGWPVALVLLGAAFFAISGMAVRVRNKYIR